MPLLDDLEARQQQADAIAALNATPLGAAATVGGLQVQGNLRNALGAGGRLVGANDFAAGQEAQADALAREAAMYQGAPSFESVREGKTSIGDYILRNTVQQLPNLGVSLGSALATRGAGRGLGALVGRGAAGATAGTVAGTVAPSVGLNVGENYGVLREDGVDPNEAAQGAAVSGTAAGLLDSLPMFGLLDKMGLGRSARQAIRGSLMGRVAKGAGTQAVAEGATEGAQQLIQRATRDYLTDNVEFFDDDTLKELLEASAAGFTVGGVTGGAGGALSGLTPQNAFADDGLGKGPIGEKIRQRLADEELGVARASRKTGADVRQDIIQRGVDVLFAGNPVFDASSPDYDPTQRAKLEKALRARRGGEATEEQLNYLDMVMPDNKGFEMLTGYDPQGTQRATEAAVESDELGVDEEGIDFGDGLREMPAGTTTTSATAPQSGRPASLKDATLYMRGSPAAQNMATGLNAEINAGNDPILGGQAEQPVQPDVLFQNIEKLNGDLQGLDAQLDSFEGSGQERAALLNQRNFVARALNQMQERAAETASPFTRTDPATGASDPAVEYGTQSLYDRLVESARGKGQQDIGFNVRNEVSRVAKNWVRRHSKTGKELTNKLAAKLNETVKPLQEAENQIKTLRKQAAAVQKQLKAAPPAQRPTLQRQFDQLVAQGTQTAAQVKRLQNQLVREAREIDVVTSTSKRPDQEPLEKYSNPEVAARMLKREGMDGKVNKGYVPVDVRGVTRQYNLHGLITEQMNDEGIQLTETAPQQLMERRVATALSTVMSTPGLKLDLDALPDDHVLFNRTKGPSITWGDIKKQLTSKDSRQYGVDQENEAQDQAAQLSKIERSSIQNLVNPDELQRLQEQTDRRDADIASLFIDEEKEAGDIDTAAEPEAMTDRQSDNEYDDTRNELRVNKEDRRVTAYPVKGDRDQRGWKEGNKRKTEKYTAKSTYGEATDVQAGKDRSNAPVDPKTGRPVKAELPTKIRTVPDDSAASAKQHEAARKAYEEARSTLEGKATKATVPRTDQDSQGRASQSRRTATGTRTKSSAKPKADTTGQLTNLMHEWAKRMSVRGLRLVHSREEMTAELEAIAKMAKENGWKNSNAAQMAADLDNLNGLHIPLPGETVIYVDPTLPVHEQVETLAHELGHAAFQQLDVTPELAAQVRAAYHAWHRSNPKSQAAVGLSKAPFSEAASWLGTGKRGPVPSAYDLDFQEWLSDQVARWMTTDKKATKPIDRFFKGVADIIRNMQELIKTFLGDNTNAAKVDTSVAKLMDAIYDSSVQSKIEMGRHGKSLNEWFRSTGPGEISAALNASNPLASLAFNRLRQALTPEQLGIVGTALTQGTVRRKLLELMRADGHTHEADLVEQGATKDVSAGPGKTYTMTATEIGLRRAFEYYQQGRLKPGPQFKGVIENMIDLLATNAGVVRRDERAIEILDAAVAAMREVDADPNLKGKAAKDAVKAKTQATVGGDANTYRPSNPAQHMLHQTMEAMKKLRPLYNVVTVAASRLYDSGNPHLIDLLNTLAPRVTETGRAASYVENRDQYRGEIETRFTDALEGLSKDQQKDLLKYMQSRTAQSTPPADIKDAVEKLDKVFGWAWNYQDSAGVSLGQRGTYFPTVYDWDKVAGKRAAWVDMLSDPQYEKFIRGQLAGQTIDGVKIDKAVPLTPQQQRGYAERFVSSIIENEIEDQAKVVEGGSPFSTSSQSMSLGFIRNVGKPEHRKLLADSQSDDLLDVLGAYGRQITRKAEYTRRFGEDGKKLDAILKRAKDYGATDAEIQTARDTVDAMMGTYRINTGAGPIRKALKGIDYFLGTDLSSDPRTWRNFEGVMVTYQNIRLLAFATISSLSEIGGLVLRGDLHSAMKGLQAGAREVARDFTRRKDKTELRRLGELLGAIEHSIADDMLSQSYGVMTMGRRTQNVNQGFFRVIGLQAWTRATRLAALEAGQDFIGRLSKRTDPESDRLLDQLNLKRSDIRLDADNKLIVESDPDKRTEQDRKVAIALKRFVDESMLRPNATQRPLWGSNPDLAMFFHLKQFVFSAHDRILRRMASEASMGNWKPMAAVLPYALTALATSAFMDALRNKDGDDDDEERNDLGLYAYQSLNRAGLFGNGQLFLNMARNAEYGGTGLEDFAGPTTTQAANIMRMIFGERGFDRTAIDALPVNNMLKLVYQGVDSRLGEESSERP